MFTQHFERGLTHLISQLRSGAMVDQTGLVNSDPRNSKGLTHLISQLRSGAVVDQPGLVNSDPSSSAATVQVVGQGSTFSTRYSKSYLQGFCCAECENGLRTRGGGGGTTEKAKRGVRRRQRTRVRRATRRRVGRRSCPNRLLCRLRRRERGGEGEVRGRRRSSFEDSEL